jgi:hypothetical protein
MVSGFTKRQQRQADAAGHAGDGESLEHIDFAARQRAPARARHDGVDLAFDQAVDAGGGARHQRDAERCRQQCRQRHHARCGQEHARHRAEHDQRHDARLGQAQVALQAHAGAGCGEDDGLVHEASGWGIADVAGAGRAGTAGSLVSSRPMGRVALNTTSRRSPTSQRGEQRISNPVIAADRDGVVEQAQPRFCGSSAA